MFRLRPSVAIALALAASLSSLPVSAVESLNPLSVSTPSCDVLVTRDGTWDGLYKIAANGATSELKLADHPIDVVTSSDGRTAYVAGYGTGEMFVVDVVGMKKLATVDTEAGAIDLAHYLHNSRRDEFLPRLTMQDPPADLRTAEDLPLIHCR